MTMTSGAVRDESVVTPDKLLLSRRRSIRRIIFGNRQAGERIYALKPLS